MDWYKFRTSHNEVDLVPGDILIQKEFGGHGPLKGEVAGRIRYGQALFSHVNGGHMDSENLSLVVDIAPAKDSAGNSFPYAKVVEAADVHLGVFNIDCRDKLVYRPKDRKWAKEAASVGERLCGLRNDNYKILKSGYYSTDKAVKSICRSRQLKDNGRKFLKDLHSRVYAPRLNNKPVRCPDMFCSEFVAACYEIAAIQLKITGLKLDPRALSPKALEGHMNKRKNLFTMLGRDRINIAYPEWLKKNEDHYPFCGELYEDCDWSEDCYGKETIPQFA